MLIFLRQTGTFIKLILCYALDVFIIWPKSIFSVKSLAAFSLPVDRGNRLLNSIRFTLNLSLTVLAFTTCTLLGADVADEPSIPLRIKPLNVQTILDQSSERYLKWIVNQPKTIEHSVNQTLTMLPTEFYSNLNKLLHQHDTNTHRIVRSIEDGSRLNLQTAINELLLADADSVNSNHYLQWSVQDTANSLNVNIDQSVVKNVFRRYINQPPLAIHLGFVGSILLFTLLNSRAIRKRLHAFKARAHSPSVIPTTLDRLTPSRPVFVAIYLALIYLAIIHANEK